VTLALPRSWSRQKPISLTFVQDATELRNWFLRPLNIRLR